MIDIGKTYKGIISSCIFDGEERYAIPQAIHVNHDNTENFLESAYKARLEDKDYYSIRYVPGKLLKTVEKRRCSNENCDRVHTMEHSYRQMECQLYKCGDTHEVDGFICAVSYKSDKKYIYASPHTTFETALCELNETIQAKKSATGTNRIHEIKIYGFKAVEVFERDSLSASYNS